MKIIYEEYLGKEYPGAPKYKRPVEGDETKDSVGSELKWTPSYKEGQPLLTNHNKNNIDNLSNVVSTVQRQPNSYSKPGSSLRMRVHNVFQRGNTGIEKSETIRNSNMEV